MAEVPTLLPSNASPFLIAESETSAVRRPLPAALIKSIWNPATCPVDLLPYLAAGLGLEIWDDAWPEARQRAIVADIWRLKRNRTKLKGISGYLALRDATLVSAHRPRDKRWWVTTQTAADRAAQIAAMPQIHIALTAAAAPAPLAKAFWSGRFRQQFWRSERTWIASDAPARTAARATYVDRGVSTPVTVRGLDDPLGASTLVELAAPGSVAKFFWGARRSWGDAAWQPSDAGDHVLAITPAGDAPSFAVPRGLVPATVRPVRVADTVPVRAGQRFWGRAAWDDGSAWRDSDAGDHVYDQLTLFDPTRVLPSRQPYSFWGWSRWGSRPYTAEIRVDVPLTRPAAQFGWGLPWGRRTVWRRADMTPFWRTVEAVRIAKATRDTVWIDTRLYAPVQFTPGLRFGDPAFPTFGSQRKLS